MGICGQIIFVVGLIGVAIVYQKLSNYTQPVAAPKMDVNAYWGPGDKSKYKENPKILPFEDLVPPKAIENLKKELSREFIVHEPLEGFNNCEYGFNTVALKKVVNYWRDSYLPKWSEREAHLKSLPHFKTDIQGLRIHFLHKKTSKSSGKKIYPILLIHGWPGSVIEFYDVAKKLTTPADNRDYAFEVVIPSLPGFGWSQAASKPGMGPAEMAVVLRNLMLRLGYDKFFIQGGDWGSIIGNNLAALFPENVIGYHSNLCLARSPLALLKLYIAGFAPSYFVDEKYHDFFFPAFNLAAFMEETGYYHLQATKPDTIGAVLDNSPVGLASYVFEKFSTGTDGSYRYVEGCGLEIDFTLDQVLDNIMIYYLNNAMLTAVRIYKEAMSPKQLSYRMDRVELKVPVGCTRFKHDFAHSIDWILKDRYPKLVHSTYHTEGGHFAAYQKPKAMYEDIIKFVESVRNLSK